jgi:hypothetical protein
VKTATRQILTFSILIGMLAGTQLLAQQTNPVKQFSHNIPSKTIYVAQQQAPADQSSTNSTSTRPSQNSSPAAASPTQPSDSVPGSIMPGAVPSDQNLQAMPDNMPGAENGMPCVDNGLWDGAEPGNCCAVCGGGYCTPPCWYLEQGVRILNRSAPRDNDISFQFMEVKTFSGQTLVSDVIQYNQVLDTHSWNYNIAPGYVATIGRYLGRDSSDRDDFLEFTYWGMNTWSNAVFVDTGFRNQFQATTADGRFTYSGGGDLVTPFLVGVAETSTITGQPTSSIPAQDSAPIFNQPPGLGTFNAAWGVGGFDHVDTHSVRVDSEMHNFELNIRLRPRGRPDQLVLNPSGRWKRECQPGTYMSYLVGLRYMTLGDGFHLHSQGTVTITDNTTGDTATQPVSGNYDIQTENDLLGLQIGSDIMFRRCKWAWGVRAKVGPYVNFSRDIKDIVNNGFSFASPYTSYFFNDRLERRTQTAALIGEVGFEATYKFKPNLMGRAAYDFMWINGLALAPEQLTWDLVPSKNETINTNGGIYAHGVSLSLEWFW